MPADRGTYEGTSLLSDSGDFVVQLGKKSKLNKFYYH